MKVKSNVRAGKGGASGAGKNSSGDSSSTPDVVPVPVYPARCVLP